MEKEDLATQLREACERAGRKTDIVFGEENLKALVLYAEELRFWNRAYNLVGRKIGTEGLVSLIIDAISPLSMKGMLQEGREVVDIGSGAGLPGIPLYLMAGPFPLTVVESQRKKITFLRHACRKLQLEKVKIYPGRLEDMIREDHLSAYEIAFARAVMDPLRLIKSAELLISEGGSLIAFVGKNDAERIRKAGLNLNEKGLKVDAIRSTQRIVGKENFLAVITKTRP
jgi:16S rRNA (guanine527-N7)-methyltransferase